MVKRFLAVALSKSQTYHETKRHKNKNILIDIKKNVELYWFVKKYKQRLEAITKASCELMRIF